MNLSIREVTDYDYAAICALMNNDLELGLDIKTDVLSAQIGRMNANGNYIIKVAVCDNEIVGFVAAYKTLILEMPNEYMRMIGLVVKKYHRRKGIGTQLMNTVIQYAVQNDVAYIALNTLPRAIEDLTFYETLGFEKKSVGYSKALC